MSNTYEINDNNEVIPYSGGRASTDTRAWREASELELQQRDEIKELEDEIKLLKASIDEALDEVDNEGAMCCRTFRELRELIQ